MFSFFYFYALIGITDVKKGFVCLFILTGAGSLFVALTDLVDLLGGKTHLAYYVTLGLGEAVEEMLGVAEGNNVADLVEVEVGVDCVRAKRLVLVV